MIRRRITVLMRVALPVAISGRSFGEELLISTLIGGNAEELSGRFDDEMIDRVLDVYVHVGMYVPPVFGVVENGARLAVVGNRKDFAEAKYSDWLESEDSYILLLYGGGALVAVWLLTAIVGVIDALPVLPKVMEVVGLGYSLWFTTRYLLFKEVFNGGNVESSMDVLDLGAFIGDLSIE
ncbi:hypothetical protein RND81_12G038900 [Saponaria officinalis]|uniref:Cyanobacterial aminoacyl-tRNA synthetase CAAD domain-containing protein n=1 Tax=Saponaria officinalis TaxID=3572 RepID=A0AAW1H745_SAPOF